MTNLNLKQMEVFAAVVECGSFTEASARLYISQSTVSAHISALEKVLHVTLFERSFKKRIQLTADGRRVYQYARDVLDRCRELESTLSVDPTRELVIGASSAPSKGILPEKIRQFSQQHPNCRCVVKNGSSEAIQRLVFEGEVQLGFVGSTDNRQALQYTCIAEDHLVMITPNTPRFAQLQKQGLLGRELLTEPLIFRDYGSGTQKMIDNYLSGNQVSSDSLNIRHYAADPELLQELVALGCGVSILSALAVQDRVCAGKLLQFEVEELPICRNIYMVCRKKNELSDLAREFAAQF